MSDETAAVLEEAAPADASEETESVEPVNEDENAEAPETDSEEATDAEDDAEDEAEEETFEIDLGGNKLSIPKSQIPENVAQQIDAFTKDVWRSATQKNQETADRAKSLEARERAVEKVSSLTDESQQIYSRALQLQSELEELSRVDVLSGLNSSNEMERQRALQVDVLIRQKQQEFSGLTSALSAKESELTQAQDAEVSRRKEEGARFVEREIKGFKTEHLPAVIDYAVNKLGMSRDAAESDWALSPAMTIAVHKAMRFDAMQAARPKKGVAKPNPAPAQPTGKPKPAGGKANRNLDLVADADKMSVEEWMKRRNQQLRA